MAHRINSLNRLTGESRSVLTLISGTSLAQVLNLCFTPGITRLYCPEVFGDVSIFTSLISIVSIIICLRYELSIVIPTDDTEAYSLFRISCMFATAVSAILAIFLLIFRATFFHLIGASSLAEYWYFVPITLFFSGLTQAVSFLLTRGGKFSLLALIAVVAAVVVNISSILFGFLGHASVFARLFSTALSLLVGLMLVLAFTRKSIVGITTKHDVSWKMLVRKYKNFLVFDVWAALINNLSWAIVPLLINGLFSSYEAGQYSLGLRVIQIPMSVIGASISRVFLQSGNTKRLRGELYRYSVKSIKKMLLLTILPLLVLMVFGESIFRFVFGEGWSAAGKYNQILVPWALVWFCASPLHGVFTITQRQMVYLLFSTLNLITRVLSIYLGFRLNSIVIALILFSISGFIIYLLSLILVLREARRSDRLFLTDTSITSPSDW
jgi:lipopolysaccharide exporter